MSDVFISYSRKDKMFVERLHQALKEQGRETWVDWDAIEWTEDWWNAIERGIEGTNTFVFVISPDSMISRHCRDEIDHAVKHNKRLVPIVYREVDAAQVHSALGKLNWLFFCDADRFGSMFGELVSAIETDLEYVKAHTRLEVKAIEWNQQAQNESFLLRGVDLTTAEKWLLQGASKQPQPTELQGEYISASRAAETERQRAEARRQRAFISGVGAFAVLAVGAAGFAFQQRQEAFAQRKEAQDQRQNAEAEKLRAEAALRQAEMAKKTAEQRTKETKEALVATELARRNEAQQREVAQKRQQQAEAAQQSEAEQRQRAEMATGVANERTAEAQKQTGIAKEQTREAQKQREDAELKGKVAFAYQLATQAQLKEKGNIFDFSRWQSSPTVFTLWLGLDFLSPQAKSLLTTANITPATMNFSPDGKILAVADDNLHLFDLRNNKKLITIDDSDVLGINFSPDGNILGSASTDGSFRVWTIRGEKISTLRGHSDEVTDADYSSDGRLLATASQDGTAKIWDSYGMGFISLEHDNRINTIKFSSSGNYVVTASNDCTAKIWDKRGKLIATIVHETPVKLARFMGNDFFATVSGNSIVRIFPFKPTDPSWLKTYSSNNSGIE